MDLNIGPEKIFQALNSATLSNSLRNTVVFLNSQGDITLGFMMLLVTLVVLHAIEKDKPWLKCLKNIARRVLRKKIGY